MMQLFKTHDLFTINQSVYMMGLDEEAAAVMGEGNLLGFLFFVFCFSFASYQGYCYN